jgi:4-hydroxy-4-methyl-2-oxoglutarate aldolase
VVDLDLVQVLSGSRAAGPARTVRCGQDDNLMVHAAIAEAEPGEVLVLTMPEPRPVALVGELLATQARGRGVAALLVDAAVRDVEELREVGLPVWARWVRVSGRTRRCPARSASRSSSAGRRSDRATSSSSTRTAPRSSSRSASRRCARGGVRARAREVEKRAKLEAGALSYDLDGLRALVEK